MRTYSFLLHFLTAVSATIFIVAVTMHLPCKDKNEKNEKQIAHIYMSHQYKEEITEYAAGHQPQQIKDCCCRIQLPEQIIKHRQGYNQKQPDAQ